MSNKLKLTSIAILIIVIVTGSLFAFSLFNSKSNKEDKLAQVNSISSISNYVLSSGSVSSSTVSSFTNSSSLSSTQNQPNSSANTTSIIGVSSNVNSVVKGESSKVVGVVSSSKYTQECNLPESPNLVRTDDGCFELNVTGRIYDNSITEKEWVYLKKNYQPIAKNYYLKVKKHFISKKHNIGIEKIIKDNNNYILYFYIWDNEIVNQVKTPTDAVTFYPAIYELDPANNSFTLKELKTGIQIIN